ncbi:recombinase family protein [Streptomyces sp. NBC_00243]|uniref:recombinase family protein n=1 Tax=Streptomyces sp. NBC_00243 TaxID=2975688 RepID=UPI002DDAFDE7|nr:recombinase family protein [Streptomyces sp. NBC_00243]WRZ22175.1 recombinase family protein [Streptomyces sp. NBC_00243]
MTTYEYGYARVSTTAQDLTRQIDALKGAGIPEERIYVDKKKGADFEREGLGAVLAQLRPGDVLTLPELDRIGRTFLKCIGIFNDLRQRGIHIRALGGALPFDTRNGDDDPQTLLAVAMGSVVAQLELKYQRERRASARASREANGKSWGRPREIDRASVLEDLEEMSVMKVAAKHGIGRATVFRIKAEAKEG